MSPRIKQLCDFLRIRPIVPLRERVGPVVLDDLIPADHVISLVRSQL